MNGNFFAFSFQKRQFRVICKRFFVFLLQHFKCYIVGVPRNTEPTSTGKSKSGTGKQSPDFSYRSPRRATRKPALPAEATGSHRKAMKPVNADIPKETKKASLPTRKLPAPPPKPSRPSPGRIIISTVKDCPPSASPSPTVIYNFTKN